jgi:hypothetical protein
MSKGTTAMSAIAVLVTGGYFAYDYWDSRKAKSKAASAAKAGSSRGSSSADQTPTGTGSASSDEGGSTGSTAGSQPGSGEGPASDQPATHKVQRLKVPRVIGLTPEKATAQLVALGFKEDVLEMPPDFGCSYEDERKDIVPVGTICNQQRDEGEILMSNAKLRVVIEYDTWEHGGVKAENEWRRMPDLVGKSLAEAQALLRSKGFGDDEFLVGEARYNCGKGMVCDQRPAVDARKYANMQGELNVGN